MSGVEGLKAEIARVFGRMHQDVCYPTASDGEKAWAADEIWKAIEPLIPAALSAIEGGGDSSAAPIPTEQADGGVVERLAIAEAEVARLTAANNDLRSIPWPRAYVMERASEWKRLLREVNGYLKTCRGSCGSDIEGRDHAIAASEALIAMLAATPPATPIAGGFGSNRESDLPTEHPETTEVVPEVMEALRQSVITLKMLKRNVETEIRDHDGLFRWEGVPDAIQQRINDASAAIAKAVGVAA